MLFLRSSSVVTVEGYWTGARTGTSRFGIVRFRHAGGAFAHHLFPPEIRGLDHPTVRDDSETAAKPRWRVVGFTPNALAT